MCGIAGLHVKAAARNTLPVDDMLDELLLGIERRGRDATGYLSLSFDNTVNIDKSAVPATQFCLERKPMMGTIRTVIAHTRMATQGTHLMNENNHPVQFGTVFTTHNGHIINDYELFRKNGWERNAEVDSVAISASLFENGFDRAEKTLEQLEGAMAIAAVDVRNPGQLLLARGSASPLWLYDNEKFLIWASELKTLTGMWGKLLGTPPKDKKFYCVPEGTTIVVDEDDKLEYGKFKANHGYTYSGRYSSGTHWWGDLDDDMEGYTGSTVTTKGKRWVSKSTSGLQHRPPVKTRVSGHTSGKPFKMDLDILDSYKEWAEVDGPIHMEAIKLAAEGLNITLQLAFWLMVFCDDDVVESDPSLALIRNYLDTEYRKHYNALMTASSSYAVTPTEEPSECISCGDVLGEGYSYRCADCIAQLIAESEARADAAKDIVAASETLLAEVLEGSSSEQEAEEKVTKLKLLTTGGK